MTTLQHNTTNGFEPRDFLAGFFRTAKTVLFSPRHFYNSAKGDKGLQSPFIFLACCVLVHTFFVAVSLQNATAVTISKILFNGLVMPFATAGLLFLVLTRLFKTSGTYEQSFMVVAYSAATALVSWIPLAGFLVEFYRVYVIATGLSCVFSVRMSRAVLAITIVIVTYIVAFSILHQVTGSHMAFQ